MKAGVGFVTGRKGFRNLLKTYINNWNEHGLIEDRSIELSLFVAYDLKYFNTTANDYKRLSPDLTDRIETIDYYGASRIKKESQLLVQEGVLTDSEAELVFGEGYGKKRNAVIYAAVRNSMDALVFIDDDEYPLATFNQNGLYWSGQGVVSTHLENILDADITHGRHCGYISPIPFINFNDVLTENIFENFITALSNDIISWESIRATMLDNKGVTYADLKILQERPVHEVPEVGGMKFISGANLCFNLRNIENIAPFFNPPGARGEDTFLSTCLSDNKVLKVPCYTFHDGFLLYQNLLNGVLPRELAPVTANIKSTVKRFANATRGWVRYKPLLTYITKRNDFEYTVKYMQKAFDTAIPALSKYFKTDDFDCIPEELRRYTQNVGHHFDNFEKTKIAWKKAILWAKQNKF